MLSIQSYDELKLRSVFLNYLMFYEVLRIEFN